MTASTSPSRPLRIAIACYPTYGGSGILATELGIALAERGHEVHVISYAEPPRLQGVTLVHFHLVQVAAYPLFRYPPYDLALTSKMREVMCTRDLDIVHAHYAIPHAMCAYLAKQMTPQCRTKIVTTLHGTDITVVGSDESYREVTRFALEQSDAVLAVSKWLADETTRLFNTKKQIHVAYNFVDTARFKPSDTRGMSTPTLVHVSNFRAVKRPADVIQAFARLRKTVAAHLVLAGEGPELGPCLALAKQLGVAADVSALGARLDVDRVLADCHVLLQPSGSEAFGLAALEAMACGVPVVGYRVGGLPEVVEDGRSGYLVPFGDVDALAQRSIELLTDEPRRLAFGRAARERAASIFTVANSVAQHEQIYRDCLASRSAPPMDPREIYLDHNASSPLLAVARRAMDPYLRGAPSIGGVVGNPSSVHAAGRRARAALDRARATIAATIGASARELSFTSGGTEANVLALRGAAAARRGRAIIVGAVEHPCVLKTADALALEGTPVHIVPVDREGRISTDALARHLVDAEPALVSVQVANHELGTVQPIRAIADLAHEHGALVHADAVAAYCKIPLDVRALGVDLLSLSAHKIGGPVGIGALYVRSGSTLVPQMHGGSQEHGLRAGTESVALAVGFAAAAESGVRILERSKKRHEHLRRRLLTSLERHEIAFVVNSPRADVLANTLNISFADVERETLLIRLDLAGIRVSAGAACASGSLEPSPVLLACGLDDACTRSALRVSFGPATTGEHVDELVRALAATLAHARTARENF